MVEEFEFFFTRVVKSVGSDVADDEAALECKHGGKPAAPEVGVTSLESFGKPVRVGSVEIKRLVVRDNKKSRRVSEPFEEEGWHVEFGSRDGLVAWDGVGVDGGKGPGAIILKSSDEGATTDPVGDGVLFEVKASAVRVAYRVVALGDRV